MSDNQSELRDKLVVAYFNMLSTGKSIAEVSKIPEKELAKGESFIDDIIALIEAREIEIERFNYELGYRTAIAHAGIIKPSSEEEVTNE